MSDNVPPPLPVLKKRRISRFFRVGLALFLFGSGPLLAVIIFASLGLTRDPDPNPVGFGIMAFFTFWPSIIVMVIGITRTVSKKAVAALCFAAFAATAQAQFAPDGFDPNTNNAVRVVIVQPDKKILLGGNFTALSPNGGAPVVRNHIARLNADGTLDTGFNPDASGVVYSIALQPDGKVLVGGSFIQIGGQVRQCVARLDSNNGLADAFYPNANGDVYSIVPQLDGKILLGGLFTHVGGAPRNFIARLDPVTGLADAFDPNANNGVGGMLLQDDGKIVAAGYFTSIGGQPRNRIARLDPITGRADSFDPNANSAIWAIAFQPDGKVLAGGLFTNIGGQRRNKIARLDPATGLADSFDPNANQGVASIAVQADGKIFVGGLFTDSGVGEVSIGGQSRNHIARLDPATGLADSFNPAPDNWVSFVAPQSNGDILVAGQFATLRTNGGTTITRNNIARLVAADGTRCAECARSR